MAATAPPPTGQKQNMDFDPLNPPIPKPIQMEDEADSRLRQMIDSRKVKKIEENEEVKKEETKTDEKSAASSEEAKADAGTAIANALGFRKPKQKEEEKQKEGEDESKVEAEQKTEETKKTIVGKKKPVQQLDPVKMASEVAAAVTRETLKAAKPAEKEVKLEEFPSELTSEEDRSEYEVAKFLAETNPKYKNAPSLIVDHAKRARAYADRWEAANPGKVFNADDAEHNDFYAGLEVPWSDREFLRAEINLENKKADEKKQREQEPILKKQQSEKSVEELAPTIRQVTINAASQLAKGIGQEIFDTISKDGLDKFAENDPITAEQMGRTFAAIHPLIEAIAQLDDPQGRVAYDDSKEMHREWKRFLLEKEQELYGEDDGHGRTLVSRVEYSNMSELQKRKHWFLNRDSLIEKLTEDATAITKTAISEAIQHQKKLAAKLGFVPKEPTEGDKKKPDATKKKKAEDEEQPDTTVKPQSPTVGSGAKIDTKEELKPTGYSGVLESTSSILFNR